MNSQMKKILCISCLLAFAANLALLADDAKFEVKVAVQSTKLTLPLRTELENKAKTEALKKYLLRLDSNLGQDLVRKACAEVDTFVEDIERQTDKWSKITSDIGQLEGSYIVELKLEKILDSAEKETTTVEITIPLEGHSENTLKTLINMIYSKQTLIKQSFQLDKNLVEKETVEKLNATETIEEFKDNLVSQNIKIDDENIIFTINTDLVRAATLFFGLLNEKSKELKYASSKPTETDNEKYAFRTWLMRLGMIGDEYKETRKELLQNLNGNSAFRNVGESHE